MILNTDINPCIKAKGLDIGPLLDVMKGLLRAKI